MLAGLSDFQEGKNAYTLIIRPFCDCQVASLLRGGRDLFSKFRVEASTCDVNVIAIRDASVKFHTLLRPEPAPLVLST